MNNADGVYTRKDRKRKVIRGGVACRFSSAVASTGTSSISAGNRYGNPPDKPTSIPHGKWSPRIEPLSPKAKWEFARRDRFRLLRSSAASALLLGQNPPARSRLGAISTKSG